MQARILPVFLGALVASAAAHAQGTPEGSGFYVGGALGYARSASKAKVALGGQWSIETTALQNDVTAAWSKDLDANGFLGTLQAGYLHQLSSGLVLGGEVSIGLLNGKKTLATGAVPTPSIPTLTYALDATVEVSTPVALAAKIGFAFDHHLPYLTLGFVQAKVEASNQIVSNGNYRKLGTGSESRGGFQWGLGYTYTFDSNWSGFAELTSAKLSDLTYTTDYLPGSAFASPAYTETFTHEVTLTAFKVGVNYRF